MLPANPATQQIATSSGTLTSQWAAFLSAVGLYLRPLGQSGTTTNRPVNSSTTPLYIGQPYFDITLKKPVWVQSLNPTVWCDATGTAV